MQSWPSQHRIRTVLCYRRRAACVFFFGFLHSGEITAPSVSHYDPSAHLTVKDVDEQINSRENLTVLKVLIKALKTDPFRKGVSTFLGRRDNSLCPVAAITAYLASHGPDPGPLFRFRKGSYLTREAFVRSVREALTGAGMDAQCYSGHSFRVGVATTAAACGVEDSLIKTLGRWSSSTYLLYRRWN